MSDLTKADLLRVIEQMRTAPVSDPRDDPANIVSPAVYRLRSECPLWTNRPDPDHKHRLGCAGYDE